MSLRLYFVYNLPAIQWEHSKMYLSYDKTSEHRLKNYWNLAEIDWYLRNRSLIVRLNVIMGSEQLMLNMNESAWEHLTQLHCITY